MFVSFGGFPIDNLSEFWYTFIQSSRKGKARDEHKLRYLFSKVGSVGGFFVLSKQHAESSYWFPLPPARRSQPRSKKSIALLMLARAMVHYTTK